MRNARLDEAQAGIKNGGRNIYNLRCAGDTTLLAESKEEPEEAGDMLAKLIRCTALSQLNTK